MRGLQQLSGRSEKGELGRSLQLLGVIIISIIIKQENNKWRIVKD